MILDFRLTNVDRLNKHKYVCALRMHFKQRAAQIESTKSANVKLCETSRLCVFGAFLQLYILDLRLKIASVVANLKFTI